MTPAYESALRAAIRAAELPIAIGLVGYDVYELAQQAWGWWKSPYAGEYDLASAGFILDCYAGPGGYPSQDGALCGFGIYVPENWQQAPINIQPWSPHLNLNTRTNTLGEPVGAYYVGSRSNWHFDFGTHPEGPPELNPMPDYATQIEVAPDPALDLPYRYREMWNIKSNAQTLSRVGYAEPEGYSLTDPLTGVAERTSPWWRQWPENVGRTWTWTIRPNGRSGPARGRLPRGRNLPTRPPRNEKQKKVNNVLRSALANFVTEGCDAAQALFTALPEITQRAVAAGEHPGNATDARRRYRGNRLKNSAGEKTRAKGASVNNKFGYPTAAPPRVSCAKAAQAVYDHFEQIDVAQAVKNLLANEVEDRIIGKLSSKAAKAWGSVKHEHGLGGIGVPTAGPAI